MDPKIGTHNGTFHCDEALGCWLLRNTESFKGASITRTRDEDILKTMEAVVDVGGIYDPSRVRQPRSYSIQFGYLGNCMFDHHQREFTEVFGHGWSGRAIAVLKLSW